MLSRILESGFVKVGRWEIHEGKLMCNLVKEQTSFNVLYAYIVDDEVLYVGKTTIRLKDRMYQYQNPDRRQKTNLRVNELLSKAVSDGREIKVFALPDPGDMDYHGFHLNLAAGIEDSVISQLQPTWNKIGK